MSMGTRYLAYRDDETPTKSNHGGGSGSSTGRSNNHSHKKKRKVKGIRSSSSPSFADTHDGSPGDEDDAQQRPLHAPSSLQSLLPNDAVGIPNVLYGCDGNDIDVENNTLDDLQIQIHVIGYKRYQSIQVLLNQLLQSNYSSELYVDR